MNTHSFSLPLVTLAAVLACGAVSCVTETRHYDRGEVRHDGPRPVEVRPVAFRNTAEAKMLRDAYLILATGDHNYNGHRAAAMIQVKAAADTLGLDVSGDGQGQLPVQLSNQRLRQAKDLIVRVLASVQVRGQKGIEFHLREAIHQINDALGIK